MATPSVNEKRLASGVDKLNSNLTAAIFNINQMLKLIGGTTQEQIARRVFTSALKKIEEANAELNRANLYDY